MQDTLIYVAITREKRRLVVSGSFELYQDFLRVLLPAAPAEATIYNPAPDPPEEDGKKKA